ncbi:MAG: hypothetical protein JXR91_18035 [Deltaproteobacteria bacterium]|nr:hypothetical protein [Deltaproteobacteria bacterium]
MHKITLSFTGILLLLISITSCQKNILPEGIDPAQAIAAGMVISASESTGRYIVWAETEKIKPVTFLVEGNSSDASVKASADGLFIIASKNLYKLQEITKSVQLCDCNAFKKNNYEGKCPPSDKNIQIDYPQLTDSKNSTNLNIGDNALFEKDLSAFKNYKLNFLPLAQVGIYLFTSYSEYIESCDSENNKWESGYFVLNIESGKIESILSKDEREWIFEHEQKTAAKTLEMENSKDLNLTVIEPVFTFAGLFLNLHFSTESFFNVLESTSTTLNKETVITANGLPEKLLPFKDVPSFLNNMAFSDSNTKIGGWSTLTGRADETDLIKEIFVE